MHRRGCQQRNRIHSIDLETSHEWLSDQPVWTTRAMNGVWKVEASPRNKRLSMGDNKSLVQRRGNIHPRGDFPSTYVRQQIFGPEKGKHPPPWRFPIYVRPCQLRIRTAATFLPELTCLLKSSRVETA
jgi:hypothetical protein